MTNSWRGTQRGVGLIEVMVALLVLAIGVLGYAGMQLTALKSAEDANNRAQATLLGQDALERFLANEEAMDTFMNVDNWPNASVPSGEKPDRLNDCITQSCDADELADWEIDMLAWQAANFLPGGMIAAGECQHAAGISCVVISWNDQQPEDSMTNDGVNVDDGATCVVLEVTR